MGRRAYAAVVLHYASMCAILTSHIALLVILACRQSPNVDEIAHLAAGTTIWDYGSFELYCVNPPLVRTIASFPAALLQSDSSWIFDTDVPALRPEFAYGTSFVQANPDVWYRLLVFGRLLLIPLSVAGALFCYSWCKSLFGVRAGYVALLLWCFSPSVLTWSSVIGTDGAATSLGVGAGYGFWRWLRAPQWNRAIVAGILLGLAELAKFSWIVLFVTWPAVWLMCVVVFGKPRYSASQLLWILMIGLSIVNVGYLYEGSCTRGTSYDFQSDTLNAIVRSNSVWSSWIGSCPIPLPVDYVRGIDIQLVDFENGRPSFLLGEWSEPGRWYYYLVAMAFKIPCGTLALIALAFVVDATKRSRDRLYEDVVDRTVLLLPPAILFIVASGQSGIQAFRYIVPIMPMLFVWCGRSVATGDGHGRSRLSLVAALLAWTVASTALVYPHTMGYFNEVAGGPQEGHRYFNDTTLSWSQDHFRLRKWLNAHPDIDAPYTALEWSVPLASLGIRSKGPPPTVVAGDNSQGPVPGWHVVEKKILFGRSGKYEYFEACRPEATIGYSINVYNLTPSNVEGMRRKMGLAPYRSFDREAHLHDLRASQSVQRQIRAAMLSEKERGQPYSTDEKALLGTLQRARNVDVVAATANDILAEGLERYDVVAVPGGQSWNQAADLGPEGREAIRSFVLAGGGYVGICAGARLAASGDEWGLRLVNAQPSKGAHYAYPSGVVSLANRGAGIVALSLTTEGRRVFSGYPGQMRLMFSGGPVFETATEFSLPEYIPLADYDTEVCQFVFQEGTMIEHPAIITTRYGEGKVILFGPHPESSDEWARIVVDAVRACARR